MAGLLSRLVCLALYSGGVSGAALCATRRREAGLPRLLVCLPLFFANVLPSMLFDRNGGFEAIVYYYAVTNYAWLVNCKLLALVLNRGPLTAYLDQPVLFTWLLFFPVNVTSPHDEGHCIDHSLTATLRRLGAMLLGCLCFARMVVMCWEYGWLRDFGLNWLMYFLLTTIMELAASFSWALLGLELMPHFNEPWKTTSISEFWSLRWNLVVGSLLRDLVYDPILEGSFISRGERRKSRQPLRQLAAVLSTFVASGAMHWAVIFYIVRLHAWYNFASFCVHGCVVVLERLLWQILLHVPAAQSKWERIPWVAKALAAQFLLHSIAHVFYWRELVHCKEARQLVRTLDVVGREWEF